MIRSVAAAALGALVLLSAPVRAGDHSALRDRSLAVLDHQFGAFRDAATALHTTAQAHCAGTATKAELSAAYKNAYLTWAPLDSYQFGPVEQLSAALTVNFWPDKKNFVGRGLNALLELPQDSLSNPATIAAGSAATQGLPAIERLLTGDLPICPASEGISGYLAQTAQALYAGWFDAGGWAELTLTAGPDNPVYLSEEEFTKALFTALDFGLTRLLDARIGRPLGTYGRPFPKRAEAWRSGLSNDLIGAQIEGVAQMLERGFAEDIPEADRARVLDVLGQARDRLDKIGAPMDQAVADPLTRIRVEGLYSKVMSARTELEQRVGPALGVQTGFSAADGD